ncbi:MAG: hypothetical protein ACM31C_31290, partial [Acidobacteriota bacterium]
MTEAYELTIFRRAERFWVSPSVLSDTGFQSLPGIIAVADLRDLARALEEGAAQAEAAQQRPKAERFPPGKDFFIAAGAKSWTDFLRGATAVVVWRTPKRTRVEANGPDADGEMLVPTGEARELPA